MKPILLLLALVCSCCAGERLITPREASRVGDAPMYRIPEVLNPTLVAAPLAAPSVTLAWDEPANKTNVLGYRVYWGAKPGVYTNSVQTLIGQPATVTIGGLVPGQTYYFVAKSWNSSTESTPSNEVSYSGPVAPDGTLIINVTLVSKRSGDSTSWTIEQTPPISFMVTNSDPKKFYGSRLDIWKK